MSPNPPPRFPFASHGSAGSNGRIPILTMDHRPLVFASRCLAALSFGMMPCLLLGAGTEFLPGTSRLEERKEIPATIVRQWDAFLLREIENAKASRGNAWRR